MLQSKHYMLIQLVTIHIESKLVFQWLPLSNKVDIVKYLTNVNACMIDLLKYNKYTLIESVCIYIYIQVC